MIEIFFPIEVIFYHYNFLKEYTFRREKLEDHTHDSHGPTELIGFG
jgi:hypothetical protein